MPDNPRAKQILEILRKSLTFRENEYAPLVVARKHRDPFSILVSIILTQSCTDVAALRAYCELQERVGVTPEALSGATPREISSAIRVAGLHRQKARALKSLARIVRDKLPEGLRSSLRMSVDEAREFLTQLPKVGPKTADVFLSLWEKPTVPVDTHVARVSKRLGLVPAKGSYEVTRSSLMASFDPTDYRDIPLLFIAFGRRICKARRPLCPACPVEKLCPYPYKTKSLQGRYRPRHFP